MPGVDHNLLSVVIMFGLGSSFSFSINELNIMSYDLFGQVIFLMVLYKTRLR